MPSMVCLGELLIDKPGRQGRDVANMAHCYTCNKYLGLRVYSKWPTLDSHRFCEPCAVQYRQQRRQRVLSELCQGGDPEDIFTAGGIRTLDPDKPKGRSLVLGILAFMDKGVCFVQIAEVLKANLSWAALFGLIGAAIAESKAKAKRQEAYAEGEREILNPAEDFRGILQRAQQLFFYPLKEITRIKSGSWGFEVRMGKSRTRFAMEGGRKTYKQLRELVDAYQRAIETQTNPVLHCKPLVPLYRRSEQIT